MPVDLLTQSKDVSAKQPIDLLTGQSIDLLEQPKNVSETPKDLLAQPKDLLTGAEDNGGMFKAIASGAIQGTLGISESIWRTPEAINRWLEYANVVGEKIGLPQWMLEPRYPNPLEYLTKGIEIGGKRYAGTSDVADEIKRSREILTKEFDTFKRLANKGREANIAFKKAGQGDLKPLGNVLTDVEAWAGFIGNAVPSLYTAIKSGGSMQFLAWLEAMEVANDAAEFEQMTGQPIPPEEFTQAQAQTALINSALERYGLGKVVSPGGKNILSSIVKGALTEGTTEGLQELNKNLSEKLTFKPEQELSEGVLPSVMGGFGAGGTVSSVTHFGTITEKPSEDMPTKAAKAAQETRGIKEQEVAEKLRAVTEQEFRTNASDALYKSYQNAADHAIDWIGHKTRQFTPLNDLSDKKGYLENRYLAIGKLWEIEDIAYKTYKAFNKLSDEQQQQVYEYFTTKDADPKNITDAQARQNAINAKKAIDNVGQQLVKHGWLAEDVYEANKGEYLPRVYLKHLLGDSSFLHTGKGIKISEQGYLKKRKDIPEDIRKIILGEIADPGYLAARAIATPSRDLVVLDFLTETSTHKEWVVPGTVLEITKYDDNGPRYKLSEENEAGVKVTPWFLKSEAERLSRQSVHMKDADKKITEQIAEDYRKLSEAAFEQLDVDGAKYKQIPDTPKYGPMRGLWVHKNIFDDVVGLGSVVGDGGSIAEQILGHGGLVTKYTQIWKSMKVAMNYPTQIRNFVSNGVLLHLSGVPFHMVPIRLEQALKEIATEGKYWQIAKKYGVKGTTFSAVEMNRIQRDMLTIKKYGALGKLLDMGVAVYNFHGDVYGLSESLFKTAKIIDAMKNEGMSESDAALSAQEALFDYTLIPRSVRYLRSGPIPFITFYYKAAGQLTKYAIKNPERFLPYTVLPYLLSKYIAATYDVDDDDVEKLKKALPEWLQKRGGAYFMPQKDEHGRWQAISIGYFFPWQMFNELWGEVTEGNPGEMLGTAGIFGGPYYQLIASVLTNKDPFTKKEIVNNLDPPAKQIADIMTYLWTMNAPSYLTQRGFAGHMWRAQTGYQSPNKLTYGEPGLTTAQAMARLIGVNIYPIDPNTSREANINRMRYELQELKSMMKKKLRDPNLTENQRAGTYDQYMGELTVREVQLMEYMEESEIHPNLEREYPTDLLQ